MKLKNTPPNRLRNQRGKVIDAVNAFLTRHPVGQPIGSDFARIRRYSDGSEFWFPQDRFVGNGEYPPGSGNKHDASTALAHLKSEIAVAYFDKSRNHAHDQPHTSDEIIKSIEETCEHEVYHCEIIMVDHAASKKHGRVIRRRLCSHYLFQNRDDAAAFAEAFKA